MDLTVVRWMVIMSVIAASVAVLQPERRIGSASPGTATLSRLRRDNTDGPLNDVKADPPQIESRQGRLGPGAPVQAHRSSVATYSGGVSGTRTPQGPSRQSRPSPTSSKSDGPIPPTSPLDVSDIRCLKMASRERFSAVIATPEGLQGVTPVFEERPSIDPITSRVCQIQPTDGKSGAFQLEVTNLDACGVKSCNQDGQPWLCLTLRFPVLNGLKLPEDEIVEIRCKPQDRTVNERKDIDFDGELSPRVEQRSSVTFTGGHQEFLCEIGLFRRLPGTALFSQRIGPGTAVELGEEVQLRSIVRSNDGWFYSKMTDVAVRRLKKQSSNSGAESSAVLVQSDGCRNPAYKAIAAQHPQRDSRSSLLNNFNFRVFLFQDMDDGDSILVSARVIACVEAIDCAPTLCGDDRNQGFGRRKRRSSLSNETADSDLDADGTGKTREIFVDHLIYPNGTVAPAPSRSSLKGWESDLALRVAMPGDYYAGTRAIPLNSLESHCFLYLMLTVGLATALGVTALLVTIYCMCTCRRRSGKQVPPTAPPPEPTVTTHQSLETLMEVCYPQLQVLDALSRSVRQKKQDVQDELLKMYNAQPLLPRGNVYSNDSRMSVKKVKRRRDPPNITTVTLGPSAESRKDDSAVYWEIGSHPILPPTPV